MEASERTKVLVSNASLDDIAEVTGLLVMMRALVEANRVQRHLGFTHSLLSSVEPYCLQRSLIFFLCILKAGEFRYLGNW